MCSNQQTKFAIFLIHRLANAWHKLPRDVFAILSRTNILDDYILANYDVLHTLGEQYLVEDISDFVKEKGIAV